MAIVNAWLAWEASTTQGLSDYVLNGIPFDNDRTTFANVINDQDQVVYIALEDGNNFEVNIGTWTSATNTLSRDVLLFSTTGGFISWDPGTRQVRAIQEPISTAGFLLAANNLSDIGNAATARTNLGLGTAAVEDASNFVRTDVDNQTIDGRVLRLVGAGGPKQFLAEDNGGGGHAWYGWRTSPNHGVIAHSDGVTEADIITFDQSVLDFLPGLTISGLDGAFGYARVLLSGDQTTNLGAGNHIEFSVVGDITSDITLSGGVGQSRGILSVPAGIWMFMLQVRIVGNSTTQGQALFQVRNNDTGTLISQRLVAQVPNISSDRSSVGATIGFLDNRGAVGLPTQVEARIISQAFLDAIAANETQLFVLGVRE